MKYLIMFNHVDGAWVNLSAEERDEHQRWLLEFMEELEAQKNSQLVFFNGNEEPRTVCMKADGTTETVVGPVLSSGERVGGYYIIDADSMDEAVEWARKGRFMIGSNIVWPITDYVI